ncbi:MAG: rod-binding protein [Desulfobacterales bacterium]|nr:rod-binding protein [Desulfobacterales bacterium]
MNIDSLPSRAIPSTNQASKNDKKLRQACEDYEAIFLQELFKSMRNTVPTDGIFGKSLQKDIFESMLDQEIANSIAKSPQSVGLKDIIYNQLKKR